MQSGGLANDFIILARDSQIDRLFFRIVNRDRVNNRDEEALRLTQDIAQNTWLEIIVRYDASTRAGELRINGNVASDTDSLAATDRTTSLIVSRQSAFAYYYVDFGPCRRSRSTCYRRSRAHYDDPNRRGPDSGGPPAHPPPALPTTI